jgi:hypothetical protein
MRAGDSKPTEPELPLALSPPDPASAAAPGSVPHGLGLLLDLVDGLIRLRWVVLKSGQTAAQGTVRCTGLNELTWEVRDPAGQPLLAEACTHHRTAIRARVQRLRRLFAVEDTAWLIERRVGAPERREITEPVDYPAGVKPWDALEDEVTGMARELRIRFSLLGRMFSAAPPPPPLRGPDAMNDALSPGERALMESLWARDERRTARKEQRRLVELQRLAERQRQRSADRQRREDARRLRDLKRRARALRTVDRHGLAPQTPSGPVPLRPPPPPVPLRLELAALGFQDTVFPAASLRDYFLRERAAQWWVSNQSDDLLALPHCRLERFEYQIRTALRVIGPLRGRALLSDEVGLGKTIEAGLVLKEYLTRGMVRRFLVLTVPSLVDQWEEELSDKFGLAAATTNHPVFRENPEAFWRDQPAIVASLHTLKQPAHLAVASLRPWDLLVVDEAHYLRNRASQTWQAVNALPHQFLLLLTATPVQNSLEDLYSLVTLLRPGQLPSPREFRRRFLDAKHPHRPKEPEELRRLLGQVMVRNTRANAGVDLPPRRAETVRFETDAAEQEFWRRWESDFRQRLAELPASRASLWGRLLLQAAGSSPAAWRDALASFPDWAAARGWQSTEPVGASWSRRCELLVPLTQGEGGVVVFSQFLATQRALADRLGLAGVPTFVINGQTPAPERQPITEAFRQKGGALLLTHSGTEGRNLQFCHRLVNFDLPWNPMEIEQRIGRLHRLGQRHPVRIYNFVQAGTLQEHLLELLQEKLNLFELVVGETGLILGERFGSDEFAEEILRLWRESEGRVADAFEPLGEELAAARAGYAEVKKLDDVLFARDYESL